jgi:hypothetical protein
VKFDVCILEGSWVHISFAPEMRCEVRVKEFDQFGVTITTPFQPETLAESHYEVKTYACDFQETTRPKRGLGLGHYCSGPVKF